MRLTSWTAVEKVAAEFEEVVGDADIGLAEQVGPDRSERRLGRRARRDMLGCRRELIRRRQCLAVDLAVRRQRQPVQHHDPRRDHVVRQHRRQRRLERRAIQRRLAADIADELAASASLARHHHRRAHAILRQQPRLDLAELDPKTADLHLVVGAADIFDHAVGAPPRHVAGAVQPRARRCRTDRG